MVGWPLAFALTAAEVERKLGVHFVLVGNQGLDRATFDRGIAEWRKKRGH